MRLPLSLIVTALAASIVTAAPVNDYSNDSSRDFVSQKLLEVGHNEINSSRRNWIEEAQAFSKRDFGDDYSEEEGRDDLLDILEHLRGYVQGEDIDYDTYNLEFPQLSVTVSETEHFIKTRLEVFEEELRITLRFYESFEEAWNMFEKFDGCEYPGSERIEELMDLHVRVLSLYRFEKLGETGVADYEAQISALKSEIKDLEEEPREVMVQGIEEIFATQLTQTKESLSLVEELNVASSPEEEHTNETRKKNCPAM